MVVELHHFLHKFPIVFLLSQDQRLLNAFIDNLAIIRESNLRDILLLFGALVRDHLIRALLALVHKAFVQGLLFLLLLFLRLIAALIKLFQAIRIYCPLISLILIPERKTSRI